MQHRGNHSPAKEGPERRLPQHKIREKIGVDEGFVKKVSSAPADPSRMRSARERRKALIRKRKLLD